MTYLVMFDAVGFGGVLAGILTLIYSARRTLGLVLFFIGVVALIGAMWVATEPRASPRGSLFMAAPLSSPSRMLDGGPFS